MLNCTHDTKIRGSDYVRQGEKPNIPFRRDVNDGHQGWLKSSSTGYDVDGQLTRGIEGRKTRNRLIGLMS